jgi:rSAM/selenodomain-associated transferase 1
MAAVALVVIAKEPRPGHSKTRLCPPFSPEEAAGLAQAALRDTLVAVAATPARRHLLALDGEPGHWLPPGFEVVEQQGRGLGERLGNALVAADGAALVVGMDTPQLTPAFLHRAASRLSAPGVDAVLGPALDGGYWVIGLRRPDRSVFEGVPMSTARTCAMQLRRLRELGLSTAGLPILRDVDTAADALAVAGACPRSAFSHMLGSLAAGRDQAQATRPTASAPWP